MTTDSPVQLDSNAELQTQMSEMGQGGGSVTD